MKKTAKSKAVPKIDPFVEGLMGKLLDRLTALEKKVDVLVSRSQTLAPNGGAKAPQAPQLQALRHERTMYEAICANCSKVCEVPFRPTEERPVYCKACWAERRGGGRPHGMPALTPVAIPKKPVSTIGAAVKAAPSPAAEPSKKTKKSSSAKKPKKKR